MRRDDMQRKQPELGREQGRAAAGIVWGIPKPRRTGRSTAFQHVIAGCLSAFDRWLSLRRPAPENRLSLVTKPPEVGTDGGCKANAVSPSLNRRVHLGHWAITS